MHVEKLSQAMIKEFNKNGRSQAFEEGLNIIFKSDNSRFFWVHPNAEPFSYQIRLPKQLALFIFYKKLYDVLEPKDKETFIQGICDSDDEYAISRLICNEKLRDLDFIADHFIKKHNYKFIPQIAFFAGTGYNEKLVEQYWGSYTKTIPYYSNDELYNKLELLALTSDDVDVVYSFLIFNYERIKYKDDFIDTVIDNDTNPRRLHNMALLLLGNKFGNSEFKFNKETFLKRLNISSDYSSAPLGVANKDADVSKVIDSLIELEAYDLVVDLALNFNNIDAKKVQDVIINSNNAKAIVDLHTKYPFDVDTLSRAVIKTDAADMCRCIAMRYGLTEYLYDFFKVFLKVRSQEYIRQFMSDEKIKKVIAPKLTSEDKALMQEILNSKYDEYGAKKSSEYLDACVYKGQPCPKNIDELESILGWLKSSRLIEHGRFINGYSSNYLLNEFENSV